MKLLSLLLCKLWGSVSKALRKHTTAVCSCVLTEGTMELIK